MSDTATRRVPWEGVFTAIITPFDSHGKLDEPGLETLVKRQLDAGIHGLVPCGTTGETPALDADEWAKVIEITVNLAKGKAWVVAGTGTNNTQKSVDRTLTAAKLGVDGALMITPYYNKPTPAGLVRHFSRIAEATPELPIMVYNVPSRTGSNLTPAAFSRLMEIPSVGALKEASGNLAQIWEASRRFGGTVAVMSGDDSLNLPILEVGGVGVVSVLSNLVPEKVVELFKLHQSGKRNDALKIHDALLPLCVSLFAESSPGPVKYAMKRLDLPGGEVREPLAPVTESTEHRIDEDLKTLGLL
ncbi:MAG: 4-hydroxy-tetrahydrodipicolinate synthase [bacterium]